MIVRDNAAYQGITVRMDTCGRQSEDNVAGRNLFTGN